MENGGKQMVQPEQKGVVLMKDIGQNFPKRGYLVLERFAGSLSTAKVDVLLNKHKRFIGYDKDGNFLQEYRPSVLEVYAHYPLNDRSDLNGDGRMHDSPHVYLAAAKS